VIKVTDVGGNEKYINCDLIERIEVTPDTLLILSNGHNFMVTESPEELIERIAAFKNRCYKYKDMLDLTESRDQDQHQYK